MAFGWDIQSPKNPHPKGIPRKIPNAGYKFWGFCIYVGNLAKIPRMKIPVFKKSQIHMIKIPKSRKSQV